MEAVVAYDRVIANYPGSASIPMAYYKRGRALERLGETARARRIVRDPDQTIPRRVGKRALAKQRLEALKSSS